MSHCLGKDLVAENSRPREHHSSSSLDFTLYSPRSCQELVSVHSLSSLSFQSLFTRFYQLFASRAHQTWEKKLHLPLRAVSATNAMTCHVLDRISDLIHMFHSCELSSGCSSGQELGVFGQSRLVDRAPSSRSERFDEHVWYHPRILYELVSTFGVYQNFILDYVKDLGG